MSFSTGDIQKLIDLLKRIVSFRYWILSFPWRLRLRTVRHSYGSELLIDYLVERYQGYVPLKVGRTTFPVVILKDTLSSYDPHRLDAILGALDINWKPTIDRPLRGPYWLLRSNTGDYEHNTFVMKRITVEGGQPKIDCGVMGFFSVVRDALSIEWELLAAVATRNPRRVLDTMLPLRNRIHEISKNPLLFGSGRACGIGITSLIAYRTAKGVKIDLRRRGKLSISTRVGMYHAFPAGFFQAPFGQYPNPEFSVSHGALWEYYEEFFDVKDPSRKNIDPRWFYSKTPVKTILRLIHDKRASRTLLGVAIDLINLRPEILTMLYIDDPEWHIQNRKEFRYNKEVATADELGIRQVVMKSIDCSRLAPEVFEENGLRPDTIAPCSAAALFLALEKLNAPNKSLELIH